MNARSENRMKLVRKKFSRFNANRGAAAGGTPAIQNTESAQVEAGGLRITTCWPGMSTRRKLGAYDPRVKYKQPYFAAFPGSSD